MKENEEQLDYLSELGDFENLILTLSPEWRVQSIRSGVYRFSPHHTESEGLTIFAIRKKRGGNRKERENKKRERIVKNIPAILLETYESETNSLYQHNEIWHYLSAKGQEQLKALNKIKILSAGVALGQQKGKDFIPNTNWLLTNKLSKRLPFPKYELDGESALNYLKREAIDLTEANEKGIYIVTYHQLPLGAAKYLGNRTNNLYPKELAIRNNRLKASDIPYWE